MSFYLIIFKIPGNPKALKRHRTFRKGDFTGSYDPSKGDKADFLALASKHAPEQPFTGPLHLKLTFCFSRPKHHYRTGKNSHLLKDNAPHYHTKTPDLDNLEKFVADSLNGIFWKDDSIICSVSKEKIYGDSPYIEIGVCLIKDVKL
jgi:Holliday junction resolvase RusA-like endonuclease